MTGITRWQVRIVRNAKAVWVCFGIIDPTLVRGDGDWMPSYSFCTCCDGYPKGSPRWNGKATGQAKNGDIFTVTVDRKAQQISIVGPRGVDMNRHLPDMKYILYFTVASKDVVLEVENAFHSA